MAGTPSNPGQRSGREPWWSYVWLVSILAFIVGYFGAGAFHPDHGSLARSETVWSVFGITAYVGCALLSLLALMAVGRLFLWLGRRGSDSERLGRWAFGLTVAAFLWAVALIAAAFLAPAYSGSESSSVSDPNGTTTSGPRHTTSTLVEENGLEVLVPIAVPALITVLVWFALHHKCSRGSRASDRIAWAAVAVLAALCMLASLSVGPFMLPVALLLAAATALTPAGTDRRDAAATRLT
jgi:hypothetical protein